MANFEFINGLRKFYSNNGVSSVGQSAALLIISVGLEQDRLRGSSVCWPNVVAMERIGITSRDSFYKARHMAVDSGWLHFMNRGTRLAGEYRFCVPEIYRDDKIASSSLKSSPDRLPIQGPEPSADPGTAASPLYSSTKAESGSGGLAKAGPPPPTKRERLRRCLAKLGVPPYGEGGLDEWAGMATRVAQCGSVDEAIEAIEWIVTTAREEGRVVLHLSNVLDIAPRWQGELAQRK